MNKRIVLIALVIITGVAMLFAKYSGDSGSEVDKNDKVVIATYYFPATLEPSKDWDSWYVVEFGVGETLTKYSKTGEVIPWLAESWQISEDNNLLWEFKLREDVVFSNGVPMTATKVKESIERLYSMEDPANGGGGNPHGHFTFNSIVADDENYIIYIETSIPTPDLPGALGYPWQLIVDVEASKERNTFTESVVGTGPYIITEFQPGISLSGVRNENYWNGEPGFNEFEVVHMQDGNMRAMALMDGSIDFTVNLQPGGLRALEGNENVIVEEYAGTKTELDHMNFRGILSNEILRKAIVMSIDGNIIADNVLDGLYSWGFSVIPSGLDFDYHRLTNPYSYNFDAAVKLLDDNGIVDTTGDGIRELDGENIVLDYVSLPGQKEIEARIEFIKKLGLGVNHIVLEDYLPRLFSHDFDIIGSHDTATPTGDPGKFLSRWYSGNLDSNYSGFSNAEYDAIYEKLESEFDANVRREYVVELQQILIDNAVALISGYPEYNVCYAAGLEGTNIGAYYYYQLTPELRFK
ncbi:ABC transporter substrate-binding protein [Vibrio sp. WXL103]|uniref:ABC transporter substrate-binding protein n=1 Tax=unclassified Vibrio TaxID=2614977 RepID=UPI003EC92E9F